MGRRKKGGVPSRPQGQVASSVSSGAVTRSQQETQSFEEQLLEFLRTLEHFKADQRHHRNFFPTSLAASFSLVTSSLQIFCEDHLALLPMGAWVTNIVTLISLGVVAWNAGWGVFRQKTILSPRRLMQLASVNELEGLKKKYEKERERFEFSLGDPRSLSPQVLAQLIFAVIIHVLMSAFYCPSFKMQRSAYHVCIRDRYLSKIIPGFLVEVGALFFSPLILSKIGLRQAPGPSVNFLGDFKSALSSFGEWEFVGAGNMPIYYSRNLHRDLRSEKKIKRLVQAFNSQGFTVLWAKPELFMVYGVATQPLNRKSLEAVHSYFLNAQVQLERIKSGIPGFSYTLECSLRTLFDSDAFKANYDYASSPGLPELETKIVFSPEVDLALLERFVAALQRVNGLEASLTDIQRKPTLSLRGFRGDFEHILAEIKRGLSVSVAASSSSSSSSSLPSAPAVPVQSSSFWRAVSGARRAAGALASDAYHRLGFLTEKERQAAERQAFLAEQKNFREEAVARAQKARDAFSLKFSFGREGLFTELEDKPYVFLWYSPEWIREVFGNARQAITESDLQKFLEIARFPSLVGRLNQAGLVLRDGELKMKIMGAEWRIYLREEQCGEFKVYVPDYIEQRHQHRRNVISIPYPSALGDAAGPSSAAPRAAA